MENIHILPTDKETRLFTSDSELVLAGYPATTFKTGRNIYITSDEEIIGGKEWFLDLRDNFLFKNQVTEPMSKVLFPNCKKIILTTDADLIKDGVQAINDEFLEWFVKNPSCEKIKVIKRPKGLKEVLRPLENDKYKIIIPKEEKDYTALLKPVGTKPIAVEWLKSELTEVERNLINKTFLQLNNSLAGHRLKDIFQQAKEMESQQQGYSEEDVKEAFRVGFNVGYNDETSPSYLTAEKFIEQFKKK